MAVVFEQQQPFNPLAAYGYGQAEISQRNNPVIAGGYESSARLGTQIAESRADRSSRERMQQRDIALQQQAQLQRQTEANYDNIQSGIENDSRVQLSRQGQEDERQGQYNQQAFQAARDQFAAQQEQAQIAKRAEAAAWVNQQDMTFRDMQQMRKMEAAVSEVTNDRAIPDAEKPDMILQLRTGISRYQQRVQASQARQMESRAKEYESQVALQEGVVRKQAAFDNMADYEKIEYVIDPAMKAELEQSLPAPSAAEVQRYGSPQEARRHQVAAAARGKGGLYSIREKTGVDANGRSQFQRLDIKPEVGGQQFTPEQAAKQAQDIYSGMMKEAGDAAKNESKPGWSDFKTEYAERLKTIRDGANYLMGGGRGGQEPVAGVEAQSDNPAQWTTGFDPNNPASQSPGQKKFVAKVKRSLADVMNGPYTLSSKSEMSDAANEMLRVASDPNIPGPDKARRIQELASVDTTAERQPEQPQQPQQPPQRSVEERLRWPFPPVPEFRVPEWLRPSQSQPAESQPQPPLGVSVGGSV